MPAPRTRHGSTHPKAKLSEDIVTAMRYRHARGESLSSMARLFDVSRQAVWAAVHGFSWKRVRGE